MDDKRLTFGQMLSMAIPRTLMEAYVWWLWLHSIVMTRFLSDGHPFKHRVFTLKQIAQGAYLGLGPTFVYAGCLWFAMTVLAVFSVAQVL